MSSKPSKQNTNTTGNLNVKLKFDDDADEDKPRTWINKEGFDEFESEYRESQDDSSLANTSSVEFEIQILLILVHLYSCQYGIDGAPWFPQSCFGGRWKLI